jgi:hypothetical protein
MFICFASLFLAALLPFYLLYSTVEVKKIRTVSDKFCGTVHDRQVILNAIFFSFLIDYDSPSYVL